MGPVAQLVFKTGEVWQPHAGSVRLRGRSVRTCIRLRATGVASSPQEHPVRPLLHTGRIGDRESSLTRVRHPATEEIDRTLRLASEESKPAKRS